VRKETEEAHVMEDVAQSSSQSAVTLPEQGSAGQSGEPIGKLSKSWEAGLTVALAMLIVATLSPSLASWATIGARWAGLTVVIYAALGLRDGVPWYMNFEEVGRRYTWPLFGKILFWSFLGFGAIEHMTGESLGQIHMAIGFLFLLLMATPRHVPAQDQQAMAGMNAERSSE